MKDVFNGVDSVLRKFMYVYSMWLNRKFVVK